MILKELVERLGGTLVQGDPQWLVESVSACEGAGAFDLVFAESAPAAVQTLAGHAGVVVLKPGVILSYPHGKNIVEAAHPRLWFAQAAKLIAPRPLATGVHPRAVVSQETVLGAGVSVGPGAVLESGAQVGENTRIDAGAVIGHGVHIGVDCHIYPRAVLYPGVTLGDRVQVHAGAVLGADGFGYVRDAATGAYTQFPQQGTLVIEDDVEIGANSTIDRGALGETRVRRGVKVDNLVHVGHNCEIGEDVILVAQTGVGGSSVVGQGAVLGGQVGVADHVHIGPGVILGAQAGVPSGKTLTNKGLPPGTVMWNTPARPIRQVLREQAWLARQAKRPRKEMSGQDD